jgi:hypothetical protein
LTGVLGRNGFANPDADRHRHPALAYHRLTDERSFRAMRDLFDETFGPLPPPAASGGATTKGA